MSEEPNVILETMDLPEDEEVTEDMAATHESDPSERLEFHVQMRGYTLRDMDALIVEAAARLIVGRSGDHKLAKEIEARCVALTTAKIDDKLSGVTTEIIDQPILADFPGKTTKEPVTIREFLGLCGREYLTQLVDSHNGEISTSRYGDGRITRMQYLVSRAMEHKFKAEITAATNAAIVEIQNGIRAQHKALVESETARIREALAKATAP